ncbi:MAG: gamma-glutamylcyclotransferase [Rhodobacterales bacterium]|nr:gamma-glutamylcyclotransferase [Rhodobacterales bacterium]MDX5413811.1 gamma-glutamylcyclotransferase [Rhodobacterales bacterium]
MVPLFVYGTLRDVTLLETVVGRALPASGRQPARLADHAARWAEGQAFPLLIPAKGQEAEGLLLTGLDAQDMARLDFYEGGFGYHLQTVTVQTEGGSVPAQVWFPDEGLWQPGAAFDLAAWQARWGAINVAAAQEMMPFHGHRSAAEIARMYPMIHARAASRVAAARAGLIDDPALPTSGMTRADVTPHDLARPYADFFAVEEHHLSFRRFDGSQSPVLKRAVFVASDAAILLPYDPVRDTVLVIEQFRAGPWARGDLAPWPLEPVAGRVDPGETPEQSAHREAAEEAGLTLRRLETVSSNYPSPGSTSEYFHIFVGLCDLPEQSGGTGGVATEDEDIRSHVLPWAQFLDLLDRDLLTVGPLILAGHWLARHRDRLRAEDASLCGAP